MDPPIFVFAGRDVSVFVSAAAAQATLDRALVERGACDVFDGRGRRLGLRVVETPRRLRGFDVVDRTILVEDAEDNPSGQAELRERLVAYLRSFDLDAGYLAAAALADLVRLAAERQRERP